MRVSLINADAAAELPAAQVGGKGSQLARLHRYGLPVPEFFIIPTDWCWQERGPGVPAALSARLQAELQRRGWLDCPLAVRSSAVGEDAGAASFAGIFVSRLNVIGLAQLEQAVAAVWASLDSPAAQAYRQRLAISATPDTEAAMAVVVMPLLPAQASGIAFTCHPVSGREDQMLIHANWGLGESLVGGAAEGDEYLLTEDSSDTWRLQQCRIGSKACVSQPQAEGGTRQVEQKLALRQAQVLDQAQIETLAALVRDAALAFDFVAPFFDLEWLWDGERFWLTQARPVTRRPHHTYAALKPQATLWTRGNTCEVMPDPLQPMDWNFSRRGCNHLLEQGWRLAGYSLLPGVQRAGLFDGYLYLEASLMQWEAWDAIGLEPGRFNALMGGHQPAIKVAPPTWRQGLAHLGRTLLYVLRAPALAKRGDAEVAAIRALARQLRDITLPKSPTAIRALLHQVLRPARESLGMFFLQGAGGGSLSLLLDTLHKAFPGEGEAVGAALLAGGNPSVTAAQGYALLNLALLAKRLKEEGKGLDAPEFAAAFAQFLDQYGHRGPYETYLRSPRWREQPEKLLAQLPALAQVDGPALRARQKAAADAAWQRIKKQLPWWYRPLLQAQVKAATRDSNRREAARSAMIALLEVGRNLWLQLGQRLTAEGVLDCRDDIFLLLPSEVERYALGLIPSLGLRARLQARAAWFAACQQATPPEWFSLAAEGGGEMRTTAVAESESPEAPLIHPASGQVFRGVATGTGIARGRVRRLTHPDQGDRLQPGEILVAPSTDPGWTPLFLRAAGLVVATGGYLSHGAIVAREFALPAVVNLPGILAQLQDGDEIEVDGLRGQVVVVDRQSTMNSG